MIWWIWVIAGTFLLVAELTAVSAEFYLVLTGGSAILVGILAGVMPLLPLWAQLAAFAALVIASCLFFRARIYNKLFGSLPPVRSGPAVDEAVVLPVALAPGESCQAEHGGSFWTIRNDGRSTLQAGERAGIACIQGLTLVVGHDTGLKQAS